jgi:hypothetical protein
MLTKIGKVAVFSFVFMLFVISLCSASNVTVYNAQAINPLQPELEAIKKRIKDGFGITIYDGNGLNLSELVKIEAILNTIPKNLHNLKIITVNEFLNGWIPEPQEPARINILSQGKLGIAKEDYIADNKEQLVDAFIIAFVHELNHRVTYKYVHEDANSRPRFREEELISQTGNNHLQYIRSDFPNSFFKTHTQEFFASLSNACYQDTQACLDLGTASYDKGLKEPINQVLFFIELYSPSGNKAKMYKIGEGVFYHTDVSVVRDANGYIISISDNIGGVTYKFGRDKKGNVTSVSKSSSVTVTDVSLNPTAVPLCGSYTCTIKGAFPPDTYFGAVFTANDGSDEHIIDIWQQGPVMTHQLDETVPPGIYKIRKIFIKENGKNKVVWAGDKSLTVTTVKVTDIFFDPAVVPLYGAYTCTIKGAFPPRYLFWGNLYNQ